MRLPQLPVAAVVQPQVAVAVSVSVSELAEQRQVSVVGRLVPPPVVKAEAQLARPQLAVTQVWG